MKTMRSVLSNLRKLFAFARSDKFEIHGKSCADSVLYPWAIGSLARALLFSAQAKRAISDRVIAAITLYYSLFHFSIFLMYQCPNLLRVCQRREINSALQNGSKDPSPVIRHSHVLKFLKVCQKNGLDKSFKEAVKQAYELRSFVNYGPRVEYHPDKIFVNTCEHDLAKARKLISNLEDLLALGVIWACSNAVNGGLFVPEVLSHAGEFFELNNGIYVTWCEKETLCEAEALRNKLHTIAANIIYQQKKLQEG